MGLQQQLFRHWHHDKDGTIDWTTSQQGCQPIRMAFVAMLQRLVALACQPGARTPWAKMVRTCQQIQHVAEGLWTFLEVEGINPRTTRLSAPCASC